jgi:hypothetical protein
MDEKQLPTLLSSFNQGRAKEGTVEDEESELVRVISKNKIDSLTCRKAQARLQPSVARRQADTATELNMATNGLRRTTIWLTVATFRIALGTVPPLVIVLITRLHWL